MASRSVLQHTGDYLMSSLQYSYFMDRRNDPAAPTDGWAAKSTTEVSGEAGGRGPGGCLFDRLCCACAAPVLGLCWAAPQGTPGG